MGSSTYEESVGRLREALGKIAEEFEIIAIDESSEFLAYKEMASKCGDPEVRWKLIKIAVDSLLHREIAWAVSRAVKIALTQVLSTGRQVTQSLPMEELANLVKAHRSIEDLAMASYKDLLKGLEKDTTLYRLIKLLSDEERKHSRMVSEIVRKILGEE